MTRQPTSGEYQRAHERVTAWPRQAGDPYARLVGAVIDPGGFDMAPNPVSLATVRVFLGAELAAKLERDVRPGKRRECGHALHSACRCVRPSGHEGAHNCLTSQPDGASLLVCDRCSGMGTDLSSYAASEPCPTCDGKGVLS